MHKTLFELLVFELVVNAIDWALIHLQDNISVWDASLRFVLDVERTFQRLRTLLTTKVVCRKVEKLRKG